MPTCNEDKRHALDRPRGFETLGLSRRTSIWQHRWSRGGRETGRIGYTCWNDGIALRYRTKSRGDDAWTDVDEFIPFVETDQNFGGTRKWFLCLGYGCSARVLFGGAYYRCRHCHRLTYESQYEPMHLRQVSKAQRVRERLGGSRLMMDQFPSKPKGMHWKTYNRLLEADFAAAMAIDEALTNFGRRRPRRDR